MTVGRVFWAVLVKELRDVVRNRGIVFLLVLPLLVPVLGGAAMGAVAWQTNLQIGAGLPVAVVNGAQLPGLLDELDEEEDLRVADVTDSLEAGLQDGTLLVVLEVPADAPSRLETGQPITVSMSTSRRSWMTVRAAGAVENALVDYRNGLITERLAEYGKDWDWMLPIKLERSVVAAKGVSVAPLGTDAVISSLGPGVAVISAVTLWSALGGLNLIVEMTAGEKEKRTIDTLLVMPASRFGIVAGKIAVSVLVSCVSMGLWSFVGLLSAGMNLGEVLMVLLQLEFMMLPVGVLLTGLMAAAGVLTKNRYHADWCLILLSLSLSMLAFVAAFGVSSTPSLVVYGVPVIGVLVSVRDLMGGGLAPGALLVAWSSCAAYGLGAVLLAAAAFSRERAVVRG